MLVSEKLRTIRYELLDHEEMYDRLMQEIQTSGSINALDRYEKVLKKQFPEEVRDMYVRYVQRAAEGAAQRKAYRDLMGYLKKNPEISGWKEHRREDGSGLEGDI